MMLNDPHLGGQLRNLAARLTAIARAAGGPYDVERQRDEVILVLCAHFRSMQPEADAAAWADAVRDMFGHALWTAAANADTDVQAARRGLPFA